MVDVCRECGSEVIIEHWKEGDIVCVSCGLVLDHHIVDTRCEWAAFTDQNYDPHEEYDTDYSSTDGYESVSEHGTTSLSSMGTTAARGGCHTLGVGPSSYDLDSDLELNSVCDGESSSEEKHNHENGSESESNSESESKREERNDYQNDDNLASGERESKINGDGKESIATGDQSLPPYECEIGRLCSVKDGLHEEPPIADSKIPDHLVLQASYPRGLSF